MNFLKTLGGFVGPSATGGLPYSLDAAPVPAADPPAASSASAHEIPVVFDSLPDFTLHAGHSKADPTLAVSVFKSKQPAAQLTQNALRRLKTLRHPNVLAYMDGVEVPNNGPVIIVTEYVRPLAHYLQELRETTGGTQSAEFQNSVAWGLRSVLLALQFLNVDCKMLHGRLTPQSIFVTKGGDWKLGGLELTAELTSDGPSYIFTAFEQSFDANYKSPECQRREWKDIGSSPPYAVDMWSLACVLYYVFNDSQIRSSDLQSASNIPPALRTQFRKAIDAHAARRPSPQKVLGSSYFDTAFIKRMDFLENLAIKTSEEKVEFYKDLCANLDSLPSCFGVHKVLPALKAVVEFGAATGSKSGPVKLDPSASHMLPAMVQIGSSLSNEEFKDQVLPIIVKLFSCNDRAVRVQLLQMMEKFAVHFDAKLVNSSVIFDNICSGFTDAAPVLRELTVKSMLHIADKLSDSNLNTRVMKYFAKLQTDPEPAIRTNTTICLGKIASKINDATRPKVLFPAFSRALRDPFPHARLAGLRSMTACQEYFSIQGVAGNIIPAISPLLIDVSISVREQASLSMNLFMQKVVEEAAQMKVREEQQARDQQLKQEMGGNDHVGDIASHSTSTTPAPTSTGSSSAGYGITAWATSVVASNVSKIVGSGTAAPSPPTSTTSVSSSTHSNQGYGQNTSSYGQSTSSYGQNTSSYGQNTPSFGQCASSYSNGFGKSTSSQSLSNTFASNDLAMDDEDAWGDDNDLDFGGNSKPSSYQASTAPSGLSVARPAASSFGGSSMKLSVSRDSHSKPAATSTSALFSVPTNAVDTSDNWGNDDNWGADDDLDIPLPKVSSSMSLGSNSSSRSNSANTSRTNSFSTTSSAATSSSSFSTATLSAAPRKSLAERRAEAKAKRESRGGPMKLETTAVKKGDEWDDWGF